MIDRVAIIGGGISGLSAAFFLRQKYPAIHIDIFEAAERLGGVIRSEKLSGCILEGGPDSFLTAKRSAIELCRLLDLQADLVPSNDHSRRTFIFHEGEMRSLPEGFFLMVPTHLIPLIKTDLFSWPGKFAALKDLFSYPEPSDCTVAEFVQKRFGQEITERIVEPMISGIYGADPQKLSLQSALPQLWEMQKNGSLILQLLRKKQKIPSNESLFTTLANGMETLVERLYTRSGAICKLVVPVEQIGKQNSLWEVADELYDAVVIASSRLPNLIISEFPEMQSIWNSIHRNSAVVVALGFHGLEREGFGWLVPLRERRSILACTYVTNKFPGRSPAGLFLVRVFIGGIHAAKWIHHTDEEIQQEVRSELRRIAQIEQEPVFCKIFRSREAMPEYSVGHNSKIERLNTLIRANQGLCMTGNLFAGVGIPDCIQHAQKAVYALEPA